VPEAVPLLARLALAGLVTVTAVGCYDSLDLPEPPDLEGLAAVYDAPTGSVDTESLREAVTTALARLGSVYSLGRLEFFTESVENLATTVSEVAAEDANTERSLVGTVNAVTRCPGGSSTPNPSAATGTVDYQVNFREGALEPTIWGTVLECEFFDSGERLLRQGEDAPPAGRASYTGRIDLYLGEPLSLREPRLEALLFRLEGDLELPTATTTVGFDFRLRTAEGSEIELRVPVRDGDVVFGFGPSLSAVNLSTADGAYCCDFTASRCARLSAGSCAEPTPDGQVLSW
jgi:hypothetical protein